jgi:ATP-binding cassette, subfamily B, bacterial PglK
MESTQVNIIHPIIKLWNQLSKRRQKQFWLVFVLMLIASLAEIISLGTILPFLGALTSPEQIYQHHLMQPVIQQLNLTAPNQLILPLTIAFILSAVLAGVVRLSLLYVMTRLSYATGHDLSINIFRRTLYQKYSTHIASNSSLIINGVILKTDTVASVMLSLLTLISSAVIWIGIMAAFISIDITVSIVASVGFCFFYFGIIRYTNRQLLENSQCIADQSTQLIKSLQEGLGGIRDVLINSSQEFYCQLFKSADFPVRRATGNNTFISNSPRFVMEALGMSLIAGIAYLMTQREGEMLDAIPVLGTLALGAQRMLPALQQAYRSYSSIKGFNSSLKDVLDLLDQPLPSYLDQPLPSPILFEKGISLNDISFRYADNSPWVLEKINLNIAKGARIGFVGVTGSGKSTLLDIIMGLLLPSEGQIMIDGEPITLENHRSWQAHIAHVPQNIYLSDNTIEENIAFSIPKEQIDHNQVLKAAKHAQIDELISELPENYETIVGEQGIKLSGGQRQRIGIARALYRQNNVLIFDEATNALDHETEESVIEAIEGLGKDITILMIAHRHTTLKGCDQVVELTNKGLCLVERSKD